MKKNKKIKILFLVTEDWYFWSHRLPIACAARDNGFDVVVATRVQKHKEKIINEGFKLIPLSLIRRNKNPFLEIKAMLEIINIYKSEKPDIVHHVAMKPVIYGSIAARIVGIKATVNALAGMGYLFISDKLAVKFIQKIIKILFKILFNHDKTKLIVQNYDDYQMLIDKNIVKEKYIAIIRGSGVDITKFFSMEEPIGTPIVLLASRMLWDKGVEEFVNAATILKKCGVNAKFVLVGDNDLENPSCIPEKQLKAWDNNKIVEWHGHSDDMPSIFAKAAIVCLPSYREGLPKVLLEAASCGKPIIAADVPGCREIVMHGENGLLVPVRNEQKLADAIKYLLDNPSVRKKMGEKSRQIVVENFSVEKVINSTLNLYQELLIK
ncbi:glycosyltransferase family 4 protein [Candidatus Poribacteria bacterium]|nr:glycosyltransferase family 4 protein [Candidatus Poribacteria bacterium]